MNSTTWSLAHLLSVVLTAMTAVGRRGTATRESQNKVGHVRSRGSPDLAIGCRQYHSYKELQTMGAHF